MRRTSDRTLQKRAVESMTINETSFFRDATLFESLRSFVLPALIKNRMHLKNMTIWSAACSTGQEPFSVALLIREYFPELSSWNVRIIATDFSTAVLARAIQGRFTQFEVNRGLSPDLLTRYFTKTGTDWLIRHDIRAMVEFRENNLAGSWTMLPSLDLVLLRNVLIYFSLDVKRKTLAKVSQKLAQDGCLALGATETTINVDDAFERVSLGPGQIYKLKRDSNTSSVPRTK